MGGRYIELALTQEGYSELNTFAEKDQAMADMLEESSCISRSQKTDVYLVEWEDCDYWSPLERFAKDVAPQDFLVRYSGDEGIIGYAGRFVRNPFISLEIGADMGLDNPLEGPVAVMAELFGKEMAIAMLEQNLASLQEKEVIKFTVHSSNGCIEVDAEGHVLNHEDSWQEAPWVSVPLRFDMEEWRKNSPIGDTSDHNIDILDLGFWNVSGQYTGSEEEWRQMQRKMEEDGGSSPEM